MQENGSTSNWVTFFQKPILVPQFLFLSLLLQCFQSPFVLNPSHTSYPFCFPTLISYLCRRATGNARAVYQIYRQKSFPVQFILLTYVILCYMGCVFYRELTMYSGEDKSKTQVPLNCTADFDLFPTVSWAVQLQLGRSICLVIQVRIRISNDGSPALLYFPAYILFFLLTQSLLNM